MVGSCVNKWMGNWFIWGSLFLIVIFVCFLVGVLFCVFEFSVLMVVLKWVMSFGDMDMLDWDVVLFNIFFL